MSLLSECASGGCGAKIGPDELAAVLQGLPPLLDPRLLVGFDTADDAAVYALSPEAAVVSTVDFFPPMVEDPELFGRIAAANALSDVYAMGGAADSGLEPGWFSPEDGPSRPGPDSGRRAGLATAEEFSAAAAMERLNKYAAEKAAGFDLHAVTDVTGFGLLGHAAEMAGHDRTLVFDFESLPLLPGARGYAAEYLATAGGQRNRRHLTGRVDLGRLDPAGQELLFAPQTSGGLLISLPMAQAVELRNALRTRDPQAAIVGQVETRGRFAVVVV